MVWWRRNLDQTIDEERTSKVVFPTATVQKFRPGDRNSRSLRSSANQATAQRRNRDLARARVICAFARRLAQRADVTADVQIMYYTDDVGYTRRRRVVIRLIDIRVTSTDPRGIFILYVRSARCIVLGAT